MLEYKCKASKMKSLTFRLTPEGIKKMDKKVAEIARRVLGMSTLEGRNRDCLDFYDLSVWIVKQALEEAYQAGIEDGYQAGLEDGW